MVTRPSTTPSASRTSVPSPTMRNISSADACGETTFGATPPSMSPDGVVRAAEQRILRQLQPRA